MGMSTLTIVLTDGFTGQDVRVRVGSREYGVQHATTALLTGLAASIEAETDAFPAVVTAELVDADVAAECESVVGEGETLVLSVTGGALTGFAAQGPIGFA
jgi:hypothetical protein